MQAEPDQLAQNAFGDYRKAYMDHLRSRDFDAARQALSAARKNPALAAMADRLHEDAKDLARLGKCFDSTAVERGKLDGAEGAEMRP